MAAEPTSPAQPPQLPTAGSLAGILDVLETDDDFRALIAGEIEEPESDIDPSITVGVPDGLRPALAAGAAGKQPVVLVVASSREAEEAVESIRSWYDGDPNDVAQLEAWETLPHERLSPRADTVASRMAVFRRLKHPEEGSTLFGPIRILVMPVRSLIQPVVAGLGDVEPLVFSQGEELPLDEASRKLVENAYTRVDLVMDRGEFAVRGGIIDVFPPTLPHPVRIEFFGDEIDTIREFHASDQRTYGKDISTVWATPCRELQLTDQIRQRAKSLIGSIPNAEDMLESIANAIPVEGMESLLPALVVSAVVFGVDVLRVTALSVACCVLFEYLIQRFLVGGSLTIGNWSAVVTGVLLAFNLPASIPWWIVVIGAFVAIAIAKMTFGGLGKNPFNPALVGRVFLLIAYPVQMTSFPMPANGAFDALSGATPLAAVKHGAAPDVLGVQELLLGNMPGSLGEVAALALICGFVYLLWRRVITWQIPVSVLGTMAVFAFVVALASGSTGAVLWQLPLFHVLAGGALLGAIFMATDYSTSPMTVRGGVIFGIGIGAITMCIRLWGAYPEGMSFAILVMNATVPLINRSVKPKRFGAKK